jgi:Putative metallopeptidase
LGICLSHEVGHVLIDVLNLPTTGRDEDVVDEFSTLLLLEGEEEGEKAVINAAEWFLIEGSLKNAHARKSKSWDMLL